MKRAAALARFHIYRGWWIVATCFLTQMVAVGAGGWVFGVLIQPMGADLGWSRGRIVAAVTIATITAGLLSVRLGPFVDRHGSRGLMTLSLFTGGVALILVGQVHSVWQYYLLWAIFGLAMPGFGLLGPVVVIANWFVRRRSLAFMLFTFGSATAGVVLAPVAGRISSAWGWRSVWVLIGAAICALAPLAWIAIRRRPEDVGLLPDGDRSLEAARAAAATIPAADAPNEDPWTVRQALHTRAYWLLTLGFSLTALPASSIFIHMAPYVVSKGYGFEAGAGVVSIYGVGCVGGRPLWSFFIDRVGLHRTLVLFGALYGSAIVAFMVPTGLLAIYAAAALLGIAISGGQQLQAQSFPDYFGREVVGTLAGYSGLAYMVTRSAGPLYAALAFDASQSYLFPFASFAIASFVAAMAFFFAYPPTHPDRGDVSTKARAAAHVLS